MPRKTKADRLQDIHTQALADFGAIWDVSRDDRNLAVLCRRFANVRGAQWDWDQKNQFGERIKMEVNLVLPVLTRIKNEYRRNRVSAVFSPGGMDLSEEQLEAIMGRFRHDTLTPLGRQARDNCFDESLDGGFGGVRLRAVYEDREKGEQKITLEPIYDAALTLFFDANSRFADKSDAEHAFLLTPYTKAAAMRKWKDMITTWPNQEEKRDDMAFSWFGNGTSADVLFVAEYYLKEHHTETWRVFNLPEDMGVEDEEILDPDEEEVAALLAKGYTEAEPVKYEGVRIHKYLMSGAEVLKDCGIIAGKNIPLIPCYAHRAVIEHRERFWSPVATAMDPQIAHNLQVSRVAEIAAMPGVRIPVVYDEAIGPYFQEWMDYRVDDLPALRAKLVTDMNGGPVPAIAGYIDPPTVPQAVGELIMLTDGAVSKTMGTPENAEQVEPDMSGRAMEMIQTRIDMRTSGYIDALAETERRMAEVWYSMAHDVYVEDGRVLRTKGKENQNGMAVIGRSIRDEGATRFDVEFGEGAAEITVDVGPSSSTRRAAIANTALTMMQKAPDPQMAVILGHVAIAHIEGEGMAGVREWSRKQLVALGVEQPTDEDKREAKAAAQEAGPPQPDPQTQLAGAMAAEAEAKATKAQAETGKAMAQTQQIEAQTAETLAGIDIDERDAAIRAAQAIRGGLDAGQ